MLEEVQLQDEKLIKRKTVKNERESVGTWKQWIMWTMATINATLHFLDITVDTTGFGVATQLYDLGTMNIESFLGKDH